MENLLVQSTDETPKIDFNVNGQLSIVGVSIPENITNFYTPIIDWLNEFAKNLPATVNLTFEIEYINTSSTRVFIDFIKKVDSFKATCPNTSVTWMYEEDDEDNYDLGKDLEYSSKATLVFQQK